MLKVFRRKESASGVVVRLINAKNLNQRGQVDLMDMQAMKDGGYRYILHYVEYPCPMWNT